MKYHYELDSTHVPEGAKLKSEAEMHPAMVGAYYGSSLEYSAHVSLQFANGGDVECPAESALREIVKPKYAHGEFGAEIARETQDFPESRREVGRQIVELASIEEVRIARNTVDRWICVGDFTKTLTYVDRNGKTVSYEQLLAGQQKHRQANDEIQRKKDQYLLENRLAPTYVGGKKVNPALPDWALKEISLMNRDIWTATGVNLILQFSGIHTIARDDNFYTGALDQTQLDQLASLMDYKEYDSFFKGSLKNARISIPIQSKAQLKAVLDWLHNSMGHPKEWTEKMVASNIRLLKVPNKT